MRKFKTFCVNCGIETRNTKKDFTKPIDYCRKCINLAEAERKRKAKKEREKYKLKFELEEQNRITHQEKLNDRCKIKTEERASSHS